MIFLKKKIQIFFLGIHFSYITKDLVLEYGFYMIIGMLCKIFNATYLKVKSRTHKCCYSLNSTSSSFQYIVNSWFIF